jgi:uncharacterized membrane protein
MSAAFLLGVTFSVGLFYCWTSRINQLFFFGRSAGEELKMSAEGRAITRQYRQAIIFAMVLAMLATWAAVHTGGVRFAPLGVLGELVAFFLIFARANAKVRELVRTHSDPTSTAEPVRQAALLHAPSYWVPGIAAILLPLLVFAVSLGISILAAAHGAGVSAGWGALSGSIDRNGYAAILGLATGMMCAAVCLLVTFRSSARLRTRMAQHTIRASISLEWIAAALLIAVLVCNGAGLVISHTLAKDALIGALAMAVAIMVWNQSRSKQFVPAPVEMGADDRWRWGLFYVDRNDPALFVQSRCGTGYSLNYGRVAAWPISVGLVAYFIGSMFLLGPHHH